MRQTCRRFRELGRTLPSLPRWENIDLVDLNSFAAAFPLVKHVSLWRFEYSRMSDSTLAFVSNLKTVIHRGDYIYVGAAKFYKRATQLTRLWLGLSRSLRINYNTFRSTALLEMLTLDGHDIQLPPNMFRHFPLLKHLQLRNARNGLVTGSDLAVNCPNLAAIDVFWSADYGMEQLLDEDLPNLRSAAWTTCDNIIPAVTSPTLRLNLSRLRLLDVSECSFYHRGPTDLVLAVSTMTRLEVLRATGIHTDVPIDWCTTLASLSKLRVIDMHCRDLNHTDFSTNPSCLMHLTGLQYLDIGHCDYYGYSILDLRLSTLTNLEYLNINNRAVTPATMHDVRRIKHLSGYTWPPHSIVDHEHESHYELRVTTGIFRDVEFESHGSRREVYFHRRVYDLLDSFCTLAPEPLC